MSIRYTQYHDAKNNAIPVNSILIADRETMVIRTIIKDTNIYPICFCEYIVFQLVV